MLEKIKTLYNPIPGMPADKIGPTVGQNSKSSISTRSFLPVRMVASVERMLKYPMFQLHVPDIVGKISLPSTTLNFFDLGGQRDIRQIWEKYYDECHAVVFVVDAGDQGRLGECWEVFGQSRRARLIKNNEAQG